MYFSFCINIQGALDFCDKPNILFFTVPDFFFQVQFSRNAEHMTPDKIN